MRKYRTGRLFLALLILLAIPLFAAGETEAVSFSSFNKAKQYVEENQPKELNLGNVRFRISEMATLLDMMGEGAKLHFSASWLGTTVTDADTEIVIKKAKTASAEDLEKLIRLCPNVRHIDLTKDNSFKNQAIAALMEKYPEIEFTWMVWLDRYHYLSSDSTAYSTLHEPNAPHKLKAADLEPLKYIKGLRALDVGHNEIESLEWLQYCPDLELLILGKNDKLADISPIGSLKKLQYLELFSTSAADISPLANCTELVDLNLCYLKKVTDLSVLDGLQKLERFWGNHMDGLPKEEKERFQAAHPDTQCVFDGKHATSEGWREHPRYDHYRWCLKNRIWIPFDEPLPEEAGKKK